MAPLLLLLLLILQCSSSALSGVAITHLPGFSGALPFHLETGYVTVDEANGVELFYYFIESERNPGEDPLVLWLSGGPGCSAFNGLVFEIGPLRFVTAKYNGSIPSLVYRPLSWTKVANIIFLDSPVGSGFSFSKDPKGYIVDEVTSSKQVYEFLRKWLIEHPRFLSNHFYVAGDSYAGKVVPIVVHEIDKSIQSGCQPVLNLQGYLVGNPLTGELVDQNSQVPYAHGNGIISAELFEAIERNCQGEDYKNPDSHKLMCTSAINKFDKIISEINIYYILGPTCNFTTSRRMHMIGDRSLKETDLEIQLPPPEIDVTCSREYPAYLVYFWANNYRIREALHIKKGTVREWIRCNHNLSYTLNIPSSIIYHLNLTKKGYRALVYSGDKDMVVSFVGTQAWIRSLNFTIVDDWRSWHVDGQVAGYTRKYANDLTFATVKDAGHTAPEYKRENCFMMFDRWISRRPL